MSFYTRDNLEIFSYFLKNETINLILFKRHITKSKKKNCCYFILNEEIRTKRITIFTQKNWSSGVTWARRPRRKRQAPLIASPQHPPPNRGKQAETVRTNWWKLCKAVWSLQSAGAELGRGAAEGGQVLDPAASAHPCGTAMGLFKTPRMHSKRYYILKTQQWVSNLLV